MTDLGRGLPKEIEEMPKRKVEDLVEDAVEDIVEDVADLIDVVETAETIEQLKEAPRQLAEHRVRLAEVDRVRNA